MQECWLSIPDRAQFPIIGWPSMPDRELAGQDEWVAYAEHWPQRYGMIAVDKTPLVRFPVLIRRCASVLAILAWSLLVCRLL